MLWDRHIGRRLKLRDLYILMAVVDARGMGKAANRLNMSQPAVSQAIADLEHAIGTRLPRPQPTRRRAAIYDLSKSPDALLVHLAGGKLALGFESPDAMLKVLEAVQGAGCAFVDSKLHTPVAVYVVPKVE